MLIMRRRGDLILLFLTNAAHSTPISHKVKRICIMRTFIAQRKVETYVQNHSEPVVFEYPRQLAQWRC